MGVWGVWVCAPLYEKGDELKAGPNSSFFSRFWVPFPTPSLESSHCPSARVGRAKQEVRTVNPIKQEVNLHPWSGLG